MREKEQGINLRKFLKSNFVMGITMI